MKDAFQTRILAIALAIATLGVCVLAGFNLSQEIGVESPTDGPIWWVESQGGLRAERVPEDSPGYRAGIRTGDILQAINGQPTPRLAPLVREMYRNGAWAHPATYSILRPYSAAPGDLTSAAKLDIPVILEPADRSMAQGSRLIALVYLFIGLYVLFRRWTAPKSTHFYVFCLVSFVLYAFRPTYEPGVFDRIIYWFNQVATALQPALFLHFAVSFSVPANGLDTQADRYGRLRRGVLTSLLYVPGAFLLGLLVWAVNRWAATELLAHRLDQIEVGYLSLYYVIAAIVFRARYLRADSPLERQQLKWLTRGTLLAVCPFTLLYAIPYMSDFAVPSLLRQIALLSLVLLPLTFSWAIVRYRLMDVDLIFKRGVTYTLVTAALAGLYFALVGITSEMVHARFPGFGFWGPIVAIIVVGLSFGSLRRIIQARVDRVFDQKRFDYRETLIDFGRSLNSQTDVRALLDSIVERLPQTLLVTRVAVFLAPETETHLAAAEGFASSRHPLRLAASHGLNLEAGELDALDVRFLDFDRVGSSDHIFLENPQQVLRLPAAQQRSAGLLDLNYYLPCRVANRVGGGTRTVAVIGLGRTDDGDFLSSEDIEVLGSLAGYIGIALQNAQLYRRLEQKIAEFERLKEFNENIVESIHVGVFAVDLEDRIESWNSQMEVMYARPRAEALGQPLAAILPAGFLTLFDSIRDDPASQGTHTLYKFRLTLPSGETRTANIAIAPLLTRGFDVVGRIIIVDDITDRIELEAQLSQAEKLSSIGLLAAGVAHEVNTPLAVISSYTQMLAKYMRPLMDQPEQDARLRPVLEKITQQTFRASEIVNGLLNFSRTGSAEFTSVDLNQLLLDTLTLLDHQFKTANIQVETRFDQNLPRIHGNEGKLQQVALNLLLNARDAMYGLSDARIRIVTEHVPGRVQVLVQDFGSGIEPEHLHRIYDPFFTTKTKPRNGQHKGTGLGLAVSYGIMQEHGGKLQAESQIGVGTTFRLEFPAAALRALPATPATSSVRDTLVGEPAVPAAVGRS